MVDRSNSLMMPKWLSLSLLFSVVGSIIIFSRKNNFQKFKKQKKSARPILAGTEKKINRILQNQVYSCPELLADPVEVPSMLNETYCFVLIHFVHLCTSFCSEQFFCSFRTSF